jgi:hypothetical protein
MGERERGALRGPPLFVQPRWTCARGDQVTSGAATQHRRPHRLMAPRLTVSQAMALTSRRRSGPNRLPLDSELVVRGGVLGPHDEEIS